MKEIWMMSNRQPWVEVLIRGVLKTKTRSWAVSLPPKGSIVFVHASKALWQGWKNLAWADKMDVPNLPRGGVVGVAEVEKSRFWSEEMSDNDWEFFWLRMGEDKCVAQPQGLILKRIRSIPFIPCGGSQTPTKKLPLKLQDAIKKHPEWVA